MLKKCIALFICVFTLTSLFPLTASADMGPKPSINVTFENLGDELCYATLLASVKSTGPYYVWEEDNENPQHNENPDYDHLDFGYDVWKAFFDYAEKDDFYFLQIAWQINETKELCWDYYPPNEFKILLYFPETGEYAVSEVYESYAFDSYFTVNMENAALSADYDKVADGNDLIKAYKSYDYSGEIVSLVVRIIITFLIEMAIAFLFGYREKKQILLIAGVNGATQIILNVLLNIINYRAGELAFMFFYFIFELIVFAIEAFVFYRYLGKISIKQKPQKRAVNYAFVANAVSFYVGMVIGLMMPQIV